MNYSKIRVFLLLQVARSAVKRLAARQERTPYNTSHLNIDQSKIYNQESVQETKYR